MSEYFIPDNYRKKIAEQIFKLFKEEINKLPEPSNFGLDNQEKWAFYRGYEQTKIEMKQILKELKKRLVK